MTAPIATESVSPQERQRLEDVGFMTCMTLVLLGNYNQTGHFGGPLAYTPFKWAEPTATPLAHILGPKPLPVIVTVPFAGAAGGVILLITGFATSWPANVWLVNRGIKVPM